MCERPLIIRTLHYTCWSGFFDQIISAFFIDHVDLLNVYLIILHSNRNIPYSSYYAQPSHKRPILFIEKKINLHFIPLAGTHINIAIEGGKNYQKTIALVKKLSESVNALAKCMFKQLLVASQTVLDCILPHCCHKMAKTMSAPKHYDYIRWWYANYTVDSTVFHNALFSQIPPPPHQGKLNFLSTMWGGGGLNHVNSMN